MFNLFLFLYMLRDVWDSLRELFQFLLLDSDSFNNFWVDLTLICNFVVKGQHVDYPAIHILRYLYSLISCVDFNHEWWVFLYLSQQGIQKLSVVFEVDLQILIFFDFVVIFSSHVMDDQEK